MAKSLSIFTSKDYLTLPLAFCDHCLDVIYPNKQFYYKCDQCPDFVSCQRCINFMKVRHPPQHTFIKSHPSSIDIIGQHFGVTCDGCKEENISGPRYQCQQCDKSYDLCSKCITESNRIHNSSHTFQLIQDPLIRSNNRQLLAQRALLVFRHQNTSNNDARDPLTGWTKDDAEKIIKQEDELRENRREIERECRQLARDNLNRTWETFRMSLGMGTYLRY